MEVGPAGVVALTCGAAQVGNPLLPIARHLRSPLGPRREALGLWHASFAEPPAEPLSSAEHRSLLSCRIRDRSRRYGSRDPRTSVQLPYFACRPMPFPALP
jgi:hypothetical protein